MRNLPFMTKHGKGIKKNKHEGHSSKCLYTKAQFWQIMKVLNVLFLVAFLDVSAAGHSQLVTMTKKNVSLEEILKEVYKQTGFSYSSRQSDLNEGKNISLDVKRVAIETVMEISLRDRPLSYTIENRIIIIKRKTKSEEALENGGPIAIKGRVINEEGTPIAASIEVKGKDIKKATITDDNGYFNLPGVNPNDILIIKGVNFNTVERKVGNNLDLGDIIVTSKVTTGVEVVVEVNTGFRKAKINEETGSYEVISRKILDEQPSRNILQRLNGVAPSVLFNIGKTDARGSANSISIRGLSTINASVSPLIVLDDNIYSGNISNINPNDVESITILKDAAATSIYGVGGANGVIVITTKTGQFNKKIGVDASTTLTIGLKSNLLASYSMNSNDYIDVENELFNNGYFNSLYSLPYYVTTPVMDILSKRRAGIISAADSASQLNALRNIDQRAEYNKYFNSTSITQQHSVSIDGGSRNISWIFSGLFDKNISTQDATDQKVNLHFGNSYKILDNLLVNLSGYYTNSKLISGKPGIKSLAFRNAPYLQYADEYGRPLAIAKDYNNMYLDTVGNGNLLDWKNYPLTDYLHDRTITRTEEMIGNISINYSVFKCLQINASYQYQKQWMYGDHIADIESYYARNLINKFTNLQTTELNQRYPIPIGGIIEKQEQAIRSQNFRLQGNLSKKWGKHSLSALAGTQLRELVGLPSITNTIYGYSTAPVRSTPVDYRNVYKNSVTGVELTIPGRPTIGSTNINRFVSLYGNMAYTFNGRYILSGSFRKDASNIFGLDANDKWNPLWSTGVSWDISKESFYPLASIIPSLRFKATFGYSGNLDNSKTALPIIQYTVNSDINTVSAFIMQPNDPQLRWEKSRQINVGINFSLPNHWMNGSVEYYQKKGVDLYGETPYDYTGFGLVTNITRNIANLKTTGVDISTEFKIFENKNFNWRVSAIYNYNTNVTTKYDAPVAKDGTRLLGNDGNQIFPVVGKPLYALVAYRWAGLDENGNPQGYLNGHPSTDYTAMLRSASIYREQVVYMGPASPTHFGAVANRVYWKGVSLSVNVVYKLGYYFLKPVFQEMSLIASGMGHKEYDQRWQKPGDELTTNVPAFRYPFPPGIDMYARDRLYKSAEINVLKGDNIRLQYITVGYAFKETTRKVVLKNLELYGNISNLGIIWRANKEGIDPDYANDVMPSRGFAIGLRAKL
jgi:TonB-linked SusC/RagA family outer membrane protein